MKDGLPILAIAALLLGGADASRAEFPIFEVNGFPITQHQLVAVRSGRIDERAPAPSLTIGGMPASPHQVTVLTPRPGVIEQKIAEELRDSGLARIRFVVPSQYTVMGLRKGKWTTLVVDSRTGEPR